MTKRVLITGSTGMVGSYALKYLLEDDRVSEVISITRRSTGIQNEKLTEIIHDNFEDFSSLRDQLKNINLCVYCLAVYQALVSKEDYFKMTCDYQKALSDVLEELNPQMTFSLFSAEGATEKIPITFFKGKGIAERYLNNTIFPKKYIFRPGYIHPTSQRKPKAFAYRFFRPLMNILVPRFPRVAVEDKDLAKSMVKIGLEANSEQKYFYNKDMRKIAKP